MASFARRLVNQVIVSSSPQVMDRSAFSQSFVFHFRRYQLSIFYITLLMYTFQLLHAALQAPVRIFSGPWQCSSGASQARLRWGHYVLWPLGIRSRSIARYYSVCSLWSAGSYITTIPPIACGLFLISKLYRWCNCKLTRVSIRSIGFPELHTLRCAS